MLLFNLENDNNDEALSENETLENNTPDECPINSEQPEEVKAVEADKVTETAELTDVAEVNKVVENSDKKAVNAMGYEEPENENAVQQPKESTGAAEATVREVREIVRSKTMIVSTVAYTVSVIAGVVASLLSAMVANGFVADFSSYLNTLNLGYRFSPLEITFSGSTAVLNVVVAAFMLFALWHIVAQGAKGENKPFGTAGATIVQIYSVIGIVLSGFFVLLIVLIGLLFSANIPFFVAASDNITVTTVVWAAFGVVAVMLLLVLLYYIMAVHSVSSFKKAVKTDKPVARGSAYVGVVLIISGAVNVLSFSILLIVASILLIGLGIGGFNVSAYVPVVIVVGLLLAANAVSNFGFGSLMLRYKKSMKKLRAEFKK